MFLKILTWPWRMARWMLYTRPIHFTRFGVFYILFTLGVGAAAINTGNNLLYLMLGLLLGFIIVSGFLSDSCLWGLDVSLIAAGDFYAGQPAEWDLRANKNWFPAILVYVEAFWQELTTRHLFYWIPRYGSEQARISLTPTHRGLLQLRTLRYSTRFPFGLFEKSHREATTQSWVVFPRVQRLPIEVLRVTGTHLSDRPAIQKGTGTIPFDLREYHSGDSSKRIHWKSSAKRGHLMVTEMEEEHDISQRVRVSRWPAEASALEDFISFLASLIFTLYEQGQGVGLKTPGVTFDADRSRAHLKNILTYLALVDPAQENRDRSATAPRGSSWIDATALWERFPSIR